MKTRLVPFVVLAVACGAILSSCAPSNAVYVGADEVEAATEDALEQQVGSRPELDCGTEDVKLANGTKVDCVLTDPATGEKFEAPVTISDVDGTSYQVNVSVDDEVIDE